MKLLAKFQALAKQIEGRKMFTVTTFEVRPKAAARTITALARARKLPASELAFWGEADGLTLAWKGPKRSRGVIELLPIETMLGDWKGTLYFDDTPATDVTRRLYPLDFPSDTNADCAALTLVRARPRVMHHTLGEDTRDLGVDVAGYLALALACRGLRGWQDAVVADRAGEDTAAFRAQMTALFPDAPLAEILTRPAPRAKAPPKGGTVMERLTAALDAAGATYKAMPPSKMHGEVFPTLQIAKGPANVAKVQAALTLVIGAYWNDFTKSMRAYGSVMGGPKGARMMIVQK